MELESLYVWVVLAPLAGSIIAGLFGKTLGRALAHWACILGVGVSTLISAAAFRHIVLERAPVFEGTLYHWGTVGDLTLEIGFLIDPLSATMMFVVSFVSLMVHIYTIGYMRDDPGYQRFFSYIALFTFAMLMLCMSNNFLQLFFGWEAVGVVSYLLIGFWYQRESAIRANLKAFLVNRVGDLGFLLGVAAVLFYFDTLRYSEVFALAPTLGDRTISVFSGTDWSVMSLICILLFIGAMGKSAQFPLHVWLPDSMEGPTPISALIHAATMVTAGIFMVARMSPLFEFSETALSVVLVVGAITALFMGLLGLVQNDIKRVVAYSTLSQLGYMAVALGASAYAAAIFHLVTHAFFKALLFLAAGSVIIALHHNQDMRGMGGLRKHMPVTWLTCLIGTLALIGFPGFAGFFSKDAIIEAVHLSEVPGHDFAYWCVVIGVFVTALYSFRLYFLVFHGAERMDEHARGHLHESPWVVTVPLVLLAIPSVFIGWIGIEPMLFGEHFGESLFVLPEHDVLAILGKDFPGEAGFIAHALAAPPLFLALAGAVAAWFLYLVRPEIPARFAERLSLLHSVLKHNYGFDALYEEILAPMGRGIGGFFWRVGDRALIDGLLVNGSARFIGWFSSLIRHLQTGYLYTYAFAMIIGLVTLMSLFVFLRMQGLS